MTQPRSNPQDLTEEEYRRWCTLQNPAFVTALTDFRKSWPSPPSFPPPRVGLRIEAVKQYQAQERAYLAELVKFCNAWPTITPDDIIGGATTAPGPKVRLAPYSPVTWPRDGSLLLWVHPTATGDEVERGFQRIKRNMHLKRRGREKRSQKKVSVQKVNLEPGKESIILRVGPTATGKDAEREFQRAKKAYWPRRLRKGTRRLKMEVYNLYRQEPKFQHIARKLRISRPSVYDLLRAVCKDIGKETHKGKPAFDKSIDWDDWKKHQPGCPTCLQFRFCPSWERKLGLPSKNPFLSRGAP